MVRECFTGREEEGAHDLREGVGYLSAKDNQHQQIEAMTETMPLADSEERGHVVTTTSAFAGDGVDKELEADETPEMKYTIDKYDGQADAPWRPRLTSRCPRPTCSLH